MCVLKPTNPAVLNLCLSVPEEEATVRTPPLETQLFPLQQQQTRILSLGTFLRYRTLGKRNKTNPVPWRILIICCRRDERCGKLRRGLQQTGVCDTGEARRDHLRLPSLIKRLLMCDVTDAAAGVSFLC